MAPRSKPRIVFSHGFWWYHDPGRNFVIKMNQMFAECDWSVGRLCGLLGVGKRTFARIVEESVGISGKVWLRQLRAVEACHLLREGGEITSLAERLGFRHNSDFTHEFKKLVGVSPTFYMKSEQSRSLQIRANPKDALWIFSGWV